MRPTPDSTKAPDPRDGLDLLDAHHRQALFHLGKLAALVTRLKTRGDDDEARALAADVVHFFSGAGRAHHEDEERHVFPRLLAGGDPGIVQNVLRLQQDHGWLEEDWRELSAQLQAVAQGHAGVDFDALREAALVYTALAHDHMTLEECCIYPEARARMRAGERSAMGREMAERRRCLRRSQGPSAPSEASHGVDRP
jgi:hemerythrin-like domain-containing protein